MIDGHIHIEHQPYNKATIDEMVNVAIENNINELYILDHTHKFIEFSFLYQNIKEINTKEWYQRKKPIPIKEYLDFVKEIKKLSYPVKLHFGLEVCYFKKTEDKLRELLNTLNLDFTLGSIHFVNNIAIDITKDIYKEVDVDSFYNDYFQACYDLVESDIFTFMGHPDSIKLFNIYPSYSLLPYYDKLAKLLSEHNLETENNSKLHYSGKTKEVGLNNDLYHYLKQYNVRIHKSSDAHKASDIGKEFNLLII